MTKVRQVSNPVAVLENLRYSSLLAAEEKNLIYNEKMYWLPPALNYIKFHFLWCGLGDLLLWFCFFVLFLFCFVITACLQNMNSGGLKDLTV